MDPNRRTRLFSALGIILILAGFGYFGYRTVVGLSGRFGNGTFVSRDAEQSASGSFGDGSKSAVELPGNLDGFTSISADGGWKITITPGDYSVQVLAAENATRDVLVDRSGDSLRLSINGGISAVTGDFEAVISMPDLRRIDVAGGASISIGAVTSDDLTLNVDGAASIKAVDATVSTLHVEVDGAANVDFSQSAVTNATIDLGGAANVAIHMAGGRLEGVVSGIGNVTYSGTVSSRDVRVEGLGSVRER